MNVGRVLRLCAVSALALVLVACAGLPTTGPVGIVAVGDDSPESSLIEVASGPVPGAGPEEIVAGFLDASITPTDTTATGTWPIARQFLSEDFAETWRPSAGVTIDATGATRNYLSDISADSDSDSGSVVVELAQRASVGEGGQYVEAMGNAELAFQLARNSDGEWRITNAPDGIVLDEVSFRQVYSSYALRYYDSSWTQLVPDVRWYVRRSNVATTITQAIVEGAPSDWLAPAVYSAFPAEVLLDRNSVPIVDQVADVALNEAALGLDTRTLARMRTQLEESLRGAGTGITEVQFTVNGRELEAGTTSVNHERPDSAALVLTKDGFGALNGGELSPVGDISKSLKEFTGAISAIEVSEDSAFAVVQSDAQAVFIVGGGRVDQLNAGPGLIKPSVDPLGYIWTVPANQPQAVTVWNTQIASQAVAGAWPEAASITALRVAPDGVRIAALVTTGGRQSLVTAAIVRDEDGLPVSLGPVEEVSSLRTPASGLAWLGDSTLGVLVTGNEPLLISQEVGGPGVVQAAPFGAVSIAGAGVSGVRVLAAEGVLFAPRVAAWQEYTNGVLVLGTRAGH